jgi:hypothetical protein
MNLAIGNSVSASIASRRAQAYSSAEWEQKRQIITQLYRDEEKSLRDVMFVLAQQLFHPT